MKRWMALGLLSGFFCATVSWADMIETRKEGILNGKIMSENDREVHFKNAKGQTMVFKRSDVLFEDKEDISKKTKQAAQKFWEWLKNLPKAMRKGSDQWTDKFIGTVGAPLDRSGANAKSDQLAKAMDDASQASAVMTKKVAAANAEIARQKSEAFGSAQSSTEKKGHFTSLND